MTLPGETGGVLRNGCTPARPDPRPRVAWPSALGAQNNFPGGTLHVRLVGSSENAQNGAESEWAPFYLLVIKEVEF